MATSARAQQNRRATLAIPARKRISSRRDTRSLLILVEAYLKTERDDDLDDLGREPCFTHLNPNRSPREKQT